MMKRKLAFLAAIMMFVIALSTLAGCKKTQEEERFVGEDYGVDLFSSIDNLAMLQNDVISEQQSSYSRNGNNIDGFGMGGNVTGEYDDATPAIKTILELDSPGVVYRMWFTSFAATPAIKIYLDGSSTATVDMDMAALTSGNVSPFVKPLVADKADSSGGFVVYVPICFQKSIRIVGSAINYYNINYQVYPADKEIETFTMDLDVSRAVKILQNVTQDPKYKSDNTYQSGATNVAAGATSELIAVEGKRSVSSIILNASEIQAWTLDRTVITDDGKKLMPSASMQFKVKVDSVEQNYLYFRVPVLNRFQVAEVYFDGVRASNLEITPRHINRMEWKASDFWSDDYYAIPKTASAGKTEITVKIVGVAATDAVEISLFHVWVRAQGKLIDEIDLDNAASRNAHSYTETGTVTTPRMSLEYDPNKRISSSNWNKIYEQEELLNNLYISITYDNQQEPSVYAPISSFFGFGAYGAFETLGLTVGIKSDATMYCYYPMPFESKAVIKLENRNDVGLTGINWTIGHKEHAMESGTYGYFKTAYNERLVGTESALQIGEPYTFLQTSGAGHVVGVTHSIDGQYGGVTRFYLEGDEQIYIDGSNSHSFHGTGTEDFYNGGWYFEHGTRVHPLYGCSTHNYKYDSPSVIAANGRDRTVMIRTLITDPIIFRDGIDFKMEHGGWNERVDCNAYLLTYYYHVETPQMTLTDELDLSDASDIADHEYVKGAASTQKIVSGAKLEGLYFGQIVDDFTLMEIRDNSSFKANIDSDNAGVILHRTLSLQVIGQKADLYVDNVKVLTWNQRFRNAHDNFVREDSIFIPSQYTAGKSSITIKLVTVSSSGTTVIPWTEASYKVFSVK